MARMESGQHRTASGGALSRVLVMRGSRASIVDLRRLYATNMNGARVVSLADVWVAAQLPGDLFALSFDFIDDDGTRASQGGNPKLENGHFVKGWLDLDSRDLVWDASADLPAHWRVKAVSTIVVEETESAVPAPSEASGIRRGGRIARLSPTRTRARLAIGAVPEAGMRPRHASWTIGSRRLVAALLGCAILLAGVSSSRAAFAERVGRKSVAVLVPEAGDLRLLAFWVALGGGYFARAQGVDVHVAARPGAELSRRRHARALHRGSAGRGGSPRPDVERLISDRFPLLVAANLLENDPLNLVIRREVADRLEITSGMPLARRLGALRGVSVGVAAPDRPRLYQLFHAAGLDADMAQLEIHRGGEQIAEFNARRLDAVYVASPYLEQALDQDGVILVNQSAGDVPAFAERTVEALVVTRGFAEASPDAARALVRAVAAAEHAIHFEPNVAVEALLRAIPTLDATATCDARIAQHLRGARFPPRLTSKRRSSSARPQLCPVGGEPLNLAGIDSSDTYVLSGTDRRAGEGRDGVSTFAAPRPRLSRGVRFVPRAPRRRPGPTGTGRGRAEIARLAGVDAALGRRARAPIAGTCEDAPGGGGLWSEVWDDDADNLGRARGRVWFLRGRLCGGK